jgi:DNA damage-binding protein 1
MLESLRPKDADTDILFIGTDRLQYFTVSWDSTTNQLVAAEETMQDNAEPYMRHSQSQNKCLVDPTAKFMAMHLWEGVLSVFRLHVRKGSTSKLETLDQVRLTELWMKASTFIHSRTGHPRIASLYKTQLDQEEARVAVYRLTKDDKGGDVSKFDPHKDRELDQVIADPYASMLIPVPIVEGKRYHVRNNDGARAHLGGLLVVGETLLTYFDSLNYSSLSSALQEPKIYVAWAEYDGTHYLLADDYGRLDLLTIEITSEPTGILVTGMKVEPMKFQDSTALTSRASKLVYMGDDMLFLASHHGDSQLLQIDIESRQMFATKTLSNNAPILDFAIMDMGNREGESQQGNAFSSGQARIVAGCGAYKDGSLRSIRSGVGLDDRGILDEIEGARGLFSVAYASDQVDTLVVSCIGETRIFQFDESGGIEELFEFCGMDLQAETMLAMDLKNGMLLQVTPHKVSVLEMANGKAKHTWSPVNGQITAASCNGKWVLLAVDGATLISLNVRNELKANGRRTDESSILSEKEQISCLHAARDLDDVGVVGFWKSGTVSVINLETLEAVLKGPLRQTEDSASVPRDIALVQLHPHDVSGPTLLVAMEDGNIVTFNVSVDPLALSRRKTVTLGSSPARLHVLPELDGTCKVFATTDHASLIYSSEKRIIYSATTADDATYVVPFDSAAFPKSIVLSTDNHLRICHIDKERLTHVKALPIHETVRRVAYSPAVKAFGLGCIKKELIHNEEVITSSVKLVDEVVLQELGSPFVLDASTSLEMVECVIRAQLRDSTGGMAERFIVGTSFIADDEMSEAGETRGRILVLGVDEDKQLYSIVSHNLKGACRCLSMMGQHIVAGLAKTVVVYNYTEETSTTGSLQKIAAYRPASFPVDLDVSGNTIGVVDLMQSLSLVEFVPSIDNAPAKLEEKARHYQPGWATSVCHLDDDKWLEADAQGNIVVLRRNPDAPTAQDRNRLDIISEMNIGEQINRIRKLNVPKNQNDIVSPRAFLGSVSIIEKKHCFLNTC